ncbi:MAG: hypothetical protein ACI9CE_003485 [Flavobacterium sp.]
MLSLQLKSYNYETFSNQTENRYILMLKVVSLEFIKRLIVAGLDFVNNSSRRQFHIYRVKSLIGLKK